MPEIMIKNGTKRLAYDGTDNHRPWGGGGHAHNGPMEPFDSLALVGADSTVESHPAYHVTPEGDKHALPGKVMLVREGLPIAIVGERYTPVQDRDVMALAEAAGLVIDSVALLGRGEGFYAQAYLETQDIRSGDPVKGYLTLRNSHDGSSLVLAGRSTVRIRCKNTLAMATRDAKSSGTSMRHTASVGGKLLDLAAELAHAYQGFTRDVEILRELARREVTPKRVEQVLAAAFPARRTTNEDGTVTEAARALGQRRKVQEIFEEHRHETDGTTEYDLLMALTAYTSHEVTVRGASNKDTAQDTRWMRSVVEGDAPTERALSVLLQTVGVG